MKTRTRQLTRMAMLIALSVIGAFIKLGLSSIAMDAAPGFFAALFLGPGEGALVCMLGHLAVAAATGFPLSLPFHLVIALVMALVGAVGGFTARRFGKLLSTVVMILLNGVGSPAALALVPNPMGTALFAAYVMPLTIAAAVNGLVAWAVAEVVNRAGVHA